MRKFIVATTIAATAAMGVTIPAASAVDAFSCGALELGLKAADMLRDGKKTTRGELEQNLMKKGDADLMKLGRIIDGTFKSEGKKKDAHSIAVSAAKCDIVREGVSDELSTLGNNLSTQVEGTFDSKKKDKDNWSSSDVFSAFSSGISS